MYVPGILSAYRTTPATESTIMSPYFIIFERECRLLLDQTLLPNKMGLDAQTYVEDICKSLEVGQAIAREYIARAQAKYSKHFNKKSSEPIYNVANKVLVKIKKASIEVRSKLHKKYTGLF